MTKRIQELIPQPWTFPYPDREMYSREQMAHMAELIVQECAAVSQDHGRTYYDSHGDRIAKLIKQHFGVN
jgi:hypothetical protein